MKKGGKTFARKISYNLKFDLKLSVVDAIGKGVESSMATAEKAHCTLALSPWTGTVD